MLFGPIGCRPIRGTLCKAAQRLALPALGWAAERRPSGNMLRGKKMLGMAPEAPASGARFVRR